MIAVIDNFDSFTYNLVHYIEEILNEDVIVMRNDALDHKVLEKSSHILLSPGPGLPKESGQLMEVIEKYYSKKKILGVCLGQQAIAEYFGGTLENMTSVKHGIATKIETNSKSELYKGLSVSIDVGRYHSWIVSREQFPEDLEITGWDSEGFIMSIEHKTLPIYGVQFHPESILTPQGKIVLGNFLQA